MVLVNSPIVESQGGVQMMPPRQRLFNHESLNPASLRKCRRRNRVSAKSEIRSDFAPGARRNGAKYVCVDILINETNPAIAEE